MTKEEYIRNLGLNPEQESILRLKDCNVLVNAGAGSGKTKVLTDRIVYRILFENVGIDEVLVLTFTKAAAKQMKEKVYQKLIEIKKSVRDIEIIEKINNAISKISISDISTIDSFCNKLVKENYLSINIEPNFRIMDDNEETVLANDILDDIFEEKYEKRDEKFLYLLDKIMLNDDDNVEKKLIYELKKYSENFVDKKRWLLNQKNSESIYSYYEDKINYLIEMIVEKVRYLDINIGVKKSKTREKIDNFLDVIRCHNKITEEVMDAALKNAEYFSRISDKDNKKEIDELKILKNYYIDIPKFSKDKIEEEVKVQNSLSEIISNIVGEFEKKIIEYKKRKNSYTFSDIQNFTISLLYDEKGEKTSVSNELMKHYKEIYIDEYQDSNYIQEKILQGITDGKNMFMVGDMKQSIYMFRGAEPELFNKKFNTFSEEVIGEKNIRKNMKTNYRSKKGVLNSVNNLFDKIMIPEVGDIDFDENHVLNVCVKNDIDTEKNEVISIDVDSGEDSARLQAIYIARRIRDMVDNQQLSYKDFDNNIVKRNINYSDIIVLFATKSKFEVYTEIFDEYNIPYHTQNKKGFFDTKEISFMTNLLKVIDNPYLDINLIGLLKSDFFGISDNELISIKLFMDEEKVNNKDSDKILYYYDVCVKYAEKNDEIAEKIRYFLDFYKEIRSMSVYKDIYEVITIIYEKLLVKEYFSSLPLGKERRANLEMLLDISQKFVDIGDTSINSFISYISELKNRNNDINSAKISVNDDAVKMMTIHYSKGLESEFVFIANADQVAKGNVDKKSIVENYGKFGYIIPQLDKDYKAICYPECIRYNVVENDKISKLGEKIRLLYVALTRAKNKFIVVGKKQKDDKFLDNVYYEFLKNSYKELSIIKLMKLVSLNNIVYIEEKIEDENEVITKLNIKKSDFLKVEEFVKDRIKYISECKEEKTVRRVISVSELKRVKNDDKPIREADIEEKPKYEKLGTEYGIRVHNIMKYIDFENPENEVDNLINIFFENNVKKVSKKNILKFFDSDVGERAKQAYSKGAMFREEKFRTINSAGYNVRGMIDMFFIENNEIVMLDYKTDEGITEEELKNRYTYQIKEYKFALEKITGMNVKESYIYSFSLNKHIKVLDNR